ncbi:NAD(P)-binding protein [Hesseltinella vesiculosa]|uniref:NAD(P)-binding protein n=1 Tax=Hesseltinella vesiculosa TaxID=101127 RepID=A0A1X2GD10_9FUNG|nr:NAD(P)-binding protein [Hesseltinella vesiculosa]
MYPGIKHGSVVGSDAVGTVQGGKLGAFKHGDRVLINPGVGWESDERGPESRYIILGLLPAIGTLTDAVAVNTDELVACPGHLTTEEAAALPLAGLTAYRAVFTKGLVKAGDHVLITGIGGGVALFALQFAVAAGAHVYVTSSSPKKIEQAVKMGAKGGVNYKDKNCLNDLKTMLGSAQISAVIDGAGGPLGDKYSRVMRVGGSIVTYGQTAGPSPFSMGTVLKNIDVKGSTMGSRAEFQKMVAFVDAKKLRPVVSRVWEQLTAESLEEAIETMSNGDQFGKLVIKIDGRPHSPKL